MATVYKIARTTPGRISAGSSRTAALETGSRVLAAVTVLIGDQVPGLADVTVLIAVRVRARAHEMCPTALMAATSAGTVAVATVLETSEYRTLPARTTEVHSVDRA